MAKKSGGPNKSQAIRDYYATNPKAKPMEVSDALKAQGLSVTPAFVSTIRSTSKKKKVGKPGRPAGSTKRGPTPAAEAVSKKRGRPAGKKSAASSAGRPAASSKSSGSVSIDSLIKVKNMVESMGSIEEARAALSALERLMK